MIRMLRDFFTVTDAEGVAHPPSSMWRITVVLVVESVGLVVALYAIGRIWEALH